MSDLRHTLSSSPIEEMEEKAPASNIPSEPQEDLEELEKNQEADLQLLTAYYRTKLKQERLRAAGFLRGTQGANYRLSHPLADPDDPTHAMHRSDPPDEEHGAPSTSGYRLSHPLADPNDPTHAMHRSDPPDEEHGAPGTSGYRLSHPLADPDNPTHAMHRSDSPNEKRGRPGSPRYPPSRERFRI